MTIPGELREQVRQRAQRACEYCGITETDAGGFLTVDHFQPQAHGGTNHPDNLLYCCHNCNLYKADYWPQEPGDPALWNPRQDPMEAHLLLLTDGRLYPITTIGALTLRRLRLNRPPLLACRKRKQERAEERRLLTRYQDVLVLLDQLHKQQAALLEEQRVLLDEQRALLRLLLGTSESE